MKTEMAKWGNSLALRIPRPFADELGVKEGSAVEMTMRDGVMMIARPKRKRRYTIEEVCVGLTKQEELDWGPDVGAEILPPY